MDLSPVLRPTLPGAQTRACGHVQLHDAACSHEILASAQDGDVNRQHMDLQAYDLTMKFCGFKRQQIQHLANNQW